MTKIKRHLIAATSLLAAVSSSYAFDWQPAAIQPNPAFDITQAYQVERVAISCYDIAGLEMSTIMPLWIDEDGNEIPALSGVHDPWGWDPAQFEYYFSIDQFSQNGEYILRFPEGMLTNADGELSSQVEIPYSFDVAELAGAMFDDFSVLSISPLLSDPQGVWDELEIRINTNHNDAIGLTMLTISDLTADEVILISSNYSTGRTPGEASEIVWTIGGTHKFLQDHNYRAQIVFYNGKDQNNSMGEPTPVVDRISYYFTGKVEGYKYSPATLLGVSPDPNTTLISEPSQAVFTYQFSSPVTLYKAETPMGQNGKHTYSPSSISSNADKTVWTLDLSEDSFIKQQDSSVVISVYVRDEEGLQLQGNFGSEENSCYQFAWTCELGAEPISIVSPAPGAVLSRLTEVCVESLSGQPMVWTYNGVANIFDTTGATLGELVYEPTSESREASSKFTFTKWIDANGEIAPLHLEAEGKYILLFSPRCFVFGEQYDTVLSHSALSIFDISAGGAVEEMESAKEPEIYDLFGRKVLNHDCDALPQGIYIIDGKKIIVK